LALAFAYNPATVARLTAAQEGKMSVWKQLLLIGVLAVIGYGAYWGRDAYFPPTEPAQQAKRGGRALSVEVAPAVMREVRDTVEAVGTTLALQSVEIVPQEAGRVTAVGISASAKVQAGQVLVRLDDALERADLAEAEARLSERENAMARIRQLRETRAVSQASFEEATARLAEAEAHLERAREKLANREVRAPFDGVVGLSYVDVGARVTPGDMLVRLDDLSSVLLEFSLPEHLFAQARPGQSVTGYSAAFRERSFIGQIEAVDSRIDPVSRAFRVRAVLPNPEGVLPAGMFMALELELSSQVALTVPEEAIVFQAAQTYVYTPREGRAVQVPVVTGKRADGQVMITAGLSEGQDVVVRGLGRLRDGAAITILPGAQAGSSGS
jgi:membrane fusion protein (multidrug efflux system)